MKDEEINRAIAEACGWVRAPNYDHKTAILDRVEMWQRGERLEADYKLPNYCNDLNAMHEAEKMLTHEQFSHYSARLELVTRERAVNEFKPWNWTDFSPSKVIDVLLVHATASQRAEAFLRTINKWTE